MPRAVAHLDLSASIGRSNTLFPCTVKGNMKLWMLVVATAVVGVFTGSGQQTGQDKSWRFGPYDKRMPRQLPSTTNPFSTLPPPALRGAVVLPFTRTNAHSSPPRTPNTTNQPGTPRLRLRQEGIIPLAR